MKRGTEILVVCHCLLNANAKVYPLADFAGVDRKSLNPYMERGVGIIQLPCPEATYLGMNRWGMTREQYDHPNFRKHCNTILEPSWHQIEAFLQAGYALIGVFGMNGSPNCGVEWTCEGFTGGEIGSQPDPAEQIARLRRVPGPGVFMEILMAGMRERGISTRFLAIDEANPIVNDT